MDIANTIEKQVFEKSLEEIKREDLSNGEASALQMILDGKKGFRTKNNRRFTAYEMKNFLWEKDVHDFVRKLMFMGVQRFVYTNTSTAVMDNLHSFEKEGCDIRGLCVIEKEFLDEGKKGIEIEIPEIYGLVFKEQK